jgi:Cu+-exporting ATPase
MTVGAANAAARSSYAGQRYDFCSPGCRQRFDVDPLAHLREARDPVCGMTVDVVAPGAEAIVRGRRYVFCSPGCRDAFAADSAAYHVGPAAAGPHHD